eukprot:10204347-Lingulodinium_polyedra.AAC.1
MPAPCASWRSSCEAASQRARNSCRGACRCRARHSGAHGRPRRPSESGSPGSNPPSSSQFPPVCGQQAHYHGG